MIKPLALLFPLFVLLYLAPPVNASDGGFNSSAGVDLPIGAGGNTIMTLTATGQSVGIGTTSPASKLDVQGDVKIGNTSAGCASGIAGALRFNGSHMQYCNGSAWISLDQSPSPIECGSGMENAWTVMTCVNTTNGRTCMRSYNNAGGGFNGDWSCAAGTGWGLTTNESIKCDGNFSGSWAMITCIGLSTGVTCVRYPSTTGGGFQSWDCAGSASWGP